MTSNMYYFNGCGDKDLYKKCNTFEELCYVKIYWNKLDILLKHFGGNIHCRLLPIVKITIHVILKVLDGLKQINKL